MLGDFEPVAFVATTDVASARRFYVDVLGLEPIEESPFALVLRSGSTTIRVTPVESHVAPSHTVLGWTVPDIRSAMLGLTNRGVVSLRYEGLDQDQHGVWASPGGAHVAWFSDPDGNTLSLTQL